jgi:cell division transport system ATP-binding protein
MGLLKGFHARGATIIIATHDKELIESMSHRVICLENGRVVGPDPNVVTL